MKTWIIRCLAIISFCMLSACQEKSLQSSQIENKDLANDQVIEVVTKPNLSDDEENQDESIVNPVIVTLTDPRTLEIVRSITKWAVSRCRTVRTLKADFPL